MRAEIDAILAELASQAMAVPQIEEPEAPIEQEPLPVRFAPLREGQSMLDAHAAIEEAEIASEPSAGENAMDEMPEPSSFVAPEQPIADMAALDPVEAEQDTPDHAEAASDEPTSIAAIDMHAAEHIEAETQPISDVSAAIEPVSAEEQNHAGIVDAPPHVAAESAESDEPRQEPAAHVEMPAAGIGEAVADATVIGLHARQRKQKGGLPTEAPGSARSGRHLAAKIAACILVLLTAATILVMADRTAMGGVQSLPWMSPTAGASAADPQGDGRAVQMPDEDAAPMIDLPPLSDGILMRYRDAWPSRS